MKTNRLIYRFLCLLLPIVMIGSGCQRNEEYLFEGSSATRINKSIEELRSLLTSSEDGWILEFTPSIGGHFGSYTMHLRFDQKGEVYIANELMPLEPADQMFRSMYALRSDKGAVLSFSMYNDGYHLFADPDVDGGWGRGRGFEGDYELVLQEKREDGSLIFKGKITGNYMRMFRPSEGARTYLQRIKAIRRAAINIDELLTNNTDAWTGTLGGKTVVLYYDRGDYNRFLVDHGDGYPLPLTYTYDAEGLRLSTPLNGVSKLTWQAEDKSWRSPSGEVLRLRKDPYYEPYKKYLGRYTLHNLYEANGTKLDPVEVNFVEAKGLSYSIEPVEGSHLKYKLVAEYNRERDAFEILTQELQIPQTTESYVLMPFNAKGGDEFRQTFAAAVGQVARLNPQHPQSSQGDVYEMVDNGVWRSEEAKSFVVVRVFLGSYQVDPNIKPALFDRIYFVKHR